MHTTSAFWYASSAFLYVTSAFRYAGGRVGPPGICALRRHTDHTSSGTTTAPPRTSTIVAIGTVPTSGGTVLNVGVYQPDTNGHMFCPASTSPQTTVTAASPATRRRRAVSASRTAARARRPKTTSPSVSAAVPRPVRAPKCWVHFVGLTISATADSPSVTSSRRAGPAAIPERRRPARIQARPATASRVASTAARRPIAPWTSPGVSSSA